MFLPSKTRLLDIFLIFSLLGSTFAIAPRGAAEYQPPARQTAPKDSTSNSGTRGNCFVGNLAAMTALAPSGHIGKTVSTSPTVAWFVSNPAFSSVEFNLYEYDGNNEKNILSQTLESRPGIMSLSLNNLQAGKNYRWQVVANCQEPNRPLTPIAVGAEIEVVAASPALQAQIAATDNPLEQADFYAEAGIWYDAFSLALAAENTAVARQFQLSLLTKLSYLEALDDSLAIRQKSLQLHQLLFVLSNS